MKTEILVPLVTYPDPSTADAARAAVDVARQLGADIRALTLLADIPNVSNALSRLLLDTPDMIRRAEASSRARADELIAAFRQAADAAGLNAGVDETAVAPALAGDAAAERARYFDLSVVGWAAGNDGVRMVAEALTFGSGRPVLLMPQGTGTQALDHVAVAWDGSRVAARALSDAGPFIRRAARVTVLTVTDEKPLPDRDIGARLADALKRRGIDADAMSVESEDCPIAETLQKDAAGAGAGLLVMGGFAHSRMRDFVLGGATQGVLSDLRMPVLMAH